MINELDMGKYVKLYDEFEDDENKQRGTIKLFPGEKLSLKNLGVDRINIVKVKSNSKDIHSLIPFIKIESEFNDNEIKRLFHPIVYNSISNDSNNVIETNKEFNFPITNCTKTYISTENFFKLPEYFLTIYWEAIPIWLNEVTILLSKQSEGYTFSLHPLSFKAIRNHSPNALSGSIFISFHLQNDFNDNIILQHVIGTLTGLDNNQILSIGSIKFLNPTENKIIHIEIPNVKS
jgi:hypothetical protein